MQMATNLRGTGARLRPAATTSGGVTTPATALSIAWSAVDEACGALPQSTRYSTPPSAKMSVRSSNFHSSPFACSGAM